MYKVVLAFISAFFLVTSPAAAKNGRTQAWIVTQLSGDARIVHNGLQPASLKVNAALAPGDLIITGVNGRATLSNQADYIVIAPRSSMRLPAQQPHGITRVIQNLGTMLFRVQHNGVPHFAVDTPMLAAVVKGTTFTIIVDQNRSAVQVTQGLVEVTANDGGMKQMVEGGRTVFINRSDRKTIIDADSQPQKATATTAVAVKVNGTAPASLSTIAGLTGGLVRPVNATAESPATSTSTGTVATNAPTRSPVVELLDSTADGALEPVATTTDVVAAAEPVVETVVAVATDPLTQTVEAALPVAADPVIAIVETVTQPVVETIAPVVATVTQPVVETIAPVVETVIQPVVQTVAPVVETVIQPVVETVAPVVETIQPVVETVAPVVETVVAPVVETVAPVVQTITPVVETVTQPVVEMVAPVVAPVTQPVLAPLQTLVPGLTVPLLKPGI